MKLDDIELITAFGTITLNGKLSGSRDDFSLEVDDYEFSDEAANLIGRVYEASQIFFSNEIDISDEDIDEDLIDELIEIMAEGSFNDTARAIAIKEFTGEDFSDIEEENDNSFTVSGDSYLVLTDEEADDLAVERVKNLIDDIGIDGFSDWAKETAYSDYVDTEWFDDSLREDGLNYAYDIQSESASSDEYVNRLHEEMVERNIMSAPEWPEEDDFTHEREDYEREEFDEEEPDAPLEADFDTEEEFNDAYEEFKNELSDWEDAQSTFEEEQDDAESEHEEEQDRLEEEAEEEFENATEEYKSELESDVESNIEDFADSYASDYDNGLDYWRDNFGEESLRQVVKDNGLLDEDGFADWIVEQDGRGQSISSYDGEENEETVTYRGETETYYIYRQ